MLLLKRSVAFLGTFLPPSCKSTRCRFLNTSSVKPNRRAYFKIAAGITTGCVLTYDYLANDLTYLGAVGRFARSLNTAALITKDYFVVFQKEGSENFDRLLKEVHLKSAERLLDTCLLNGGLYIKVGQGVAAINHMLPEEYTTTLSQLQDKCLRSKKEQVQKLFMEDFGKLPEEIFQEFDYEPIAAASLAQVFKAKLNNGEEVAVKVQYIDLQNRFPSDIGTMIFLQDIVEIFFKNYNFGWILKDIRNNLNQEMDFINEAKNSEKCADHLRKFQYVHIPKVHWEHTNKRVITMEWINGIKITNMDQIKKNELNLADIDLKLFQVFAEQIFISGFVHADPHPGNLFVRRGKSGKAELVILDHGLYENLPENVRQPLCEFWEATVLKDEDKMKESAAQLNIVNYKQFAEVLFQVPFTVEGGRVKTKLTDEDIAYMKEVGRKNFKMVMQTLQDMPRNMIFVVRNLNTIRAIGREHGDPVDRPRVMARYAQRCLYQQDRSAFGFFHWMYRRIKFEYSLWIKSFKLTVLSLYLEVLYKLGRSPEDSKILKLDASNL